MSLGDLGQILGVSRRTISKYESGMGTTLEVAIRIEEYFNTGVVESIDIVHREPAEPEHEGQKRKAGPAGIPHRIPSAARDALHTLRGAPFQALLTFDKHTIMTGYGPAQKVIKRAVYQQPVKDCKEARDVYYYRLSSRKKDRPAPSL